MGWELRVPVGGMSMRILAVGLALGGLSPVMMAGLSPGGLSLVMVAGSSLGGLSPGMVAGFSLGELSPVMAARLWASGLAPMVVAGLSVGGLSWVARFSGGWLLPAAVPGLLGEACGMEVLVGVLGERWRAA
ncbi:hypothetical protein BKM31_35455 [[Actinomadura] parvosata subsp. kistnae]|uniref:Uncharacterized protein n=1 Tax=[Actinomadura] parvosata subsp. kistnae TaxID=1909395 RepID=A0A1V0A763_9ACTN|nr:hypothetical protein BKM31_35455 [Nonomuraea sp. ATCC 55076]